MLYDKDPREEEFLQTIKKFDRQRTAFPFVIIGLIVLDQLLRVPTLNTSDTAITYVLLFGIVGIGIETLNIKILLIKAEYRDWLRDFRTERWKDINDD